MTNVHRFVPRRDDTRGPPEEANPRMGEVLILPCIRYERMDARDASGGRRAAGTSAAPDPVRQDLAG